MDLKEVRIHFSSRHSLKLLNLICPKQLNSGFLWKGCTNCPTWKFNIYMGKLSNVAMIVSKRCKECKETNNRNRYEHLLWFKNLGTTSLKTVKVH